MSRRRRLNTGLLVGLVLIFAEVGLRCVRSPVACVEVVNGGDEVLENLHLETSQGVADLATVGAGESALLYLAGSREAPLKIQFRQKGNPNSDLELPAFNPAELSREGARLVIVIRPGEVERYQDQGESTWIGRIATQLSDGLKSFLN